MWNMFCLHTAMMTLNIVAIVYFVLRIFGYKLGLLLDTAQSKRPWSKRKRKPVFHVLNTVLNLDKRLQDRSLSFDTDASTIICDNSANIHICNDKSMFVGAIRRTDKHYVATIGGNKNAATCMGTVRWTWKDDVGTQHTFDIHDVLLFPQSPVNILSVTGLADQFGDDEGTGIDTKRTKSRFYW